MAEQNCQTCIHKYVCRFHYDIVTTLETSSKKRSSDISHIDYLKVLTERTIKAIGQDCKYYQKKK